jgi:Flp pilus assembly protein TadG
VCNLTTWRRGILLTVLERFDLLRDGVSHRRVLPPKGMADDSGRIDENGQAIVEIAIALPVVAAFLFTMIEICLLFYSYCMISESAREATRYAIVRGATCVTAGGASCTASSTDINNYVSQLAWPNLGNGTITAAMTYPDGNENPGNRVQVKVSYVLPYNIPFGANGTLHLASTSVMYIVQ